MDECNESLLQLDCKKCRTSFDQTIFYSVPKTDTLRFSLLWETPQSVKERKEIKDLVGYYYKRYMDPDTCSDLCCWREEYVRTCVVLLCHVFHCPGVQCFMIYDSSAWGMDDSKKEKAIWNEEQQSTVTDEPVELIRWGGTITESEKISKIKDDINTLLLLCNESNHYGVIKIDLKRRRVLIWDAARDTSTSIENYWKIHAIRALKIHQPDFVQKDEGNIVTITEQTKLKEQNDGQVPSWNQENGYPLWLVQGIKKKGSYSQTDNHSCGPIGINQFATELKKLYDAASANDKVDASILEKVKSPEELKDENYRNAADLFKRLLLTQQDAFQHSATTTNHEENSNDLCHLDEESNKNLVSMQAPNIECDRKEEQDSEQKVIRTAITKDCDKKDETQTTEKKILACRSKKDVPSDTDIKDVTKADRNDSVTKEDKKLPEQALEQQTEAKKKKPTKKRKRSESDTPKNEENTRQITVYDRDTRDKTKMQTENSRKKKDEWMRSKAKRQRKSKHYCHAGKRCRMPRVDFVLDGDGKNASKCTACQRICHHACLFKWQQVELYCIYCYKKKTMERVDTGILFDDIFQQNRKARAGEPTQVRQDLRQFIDNYLLTSDFSMSSEEFYKWKLEHGKTIDNSEEKEKGFSKGSSTRKQRKQLVINLEERKNERKENAGYHKIRNSYETAIKLATEEWMLSNDGVVTGLRYNRINQQFMARVHYERNGVEAEDRIVVSDDWIIDTYGFHLLTKLMDRRINDEFLKYPLTNERKLSMLRFDGDIIERVKYCSTIDKWKGRQKSGKVVLLQDGYIKENFGKRFVEECVQLGDNKFVPVPVGTVRKSVMSLFPNLRCEGAPEIKYQQGNKDNCVFCSFGSALYCTKIPTLVTTANILVQISNKFGGGVQSLSKARAIIQEHARWIQVKRLKNTFDWEKDITRNMFVVGVLKDSRNSQQHAITIFRNWIFDSNEPFALPLTKTNLDICTWEVKDDNTINDSYFVSFCRGYIFYEDEDKKNKILERSDLK